MTTTKTKRSAKAAATKGSWMVRQIISQTCYGVTVESECEWYGFFATESDALSHVAGRRFTTMANIRYEVRNMN